MENKEQASKDRPRFYGAQEVDHGFQGVVTLFDIAEDHDRRQGIVEKEIYRSETYRDAQDAEENAADWLSAHGLTADLVTEEARQ